ncbi:MAG: hypothetical protein RIQ79_2042 [Verrucomicrobiota bacterium]
MKHLVKSLLLFSLCPALSPAIAAPVTAPAALPVADGVLLATLPVRVTPKREATITAPIGGLFTLLIPHETHSLPEKTVWGAVDLDRLDLEARALAQAKALYSAREVIDWRVNQINDRTKLEDTLGRLRAERALLDRIDQNPALAELYFRDQAAPASPPPPLGTPSSSSALLPPPSTAPVSQATSQSLIDKTPSPAVSASSSSPERILLMRRRIDTELALLDTKLSYLGSPVQEDLELGLMRLKLEQQTFEYERRAQLARFAAPFDAEFRLLLPLKPGSTTMEVRSGDDIARLRDLTSILIQVPVTQPLWRTLPPEQLEVRVSLEASAHTNLRARFQDTLLVTRGGREELLYLFAVDTADLDAARPLVGGLLQGELYYAPGTPVRLVQKLDLAAAAPDVLREKGWPGLVASLYPGWRLACVGQSQLALLPPPAPAP